MYTKKLPLHTEIMQQMLENLMRNDFDKYYITTHQTINKSQLILNR